MKGKYYGHDSGMEDYKGMYYSSCMASGTKSHANYKDFEAWMKRSYPSMATKARQIWGY